ncbi:GAF domain-containing protein [Nocardia sp. NPDC051756]|uniref:GAF domain-containing protein n=1 Tax=Nocardia sp. NPDC051756 TaxID=3154751 RepID=UPI0034293B9A
MVASWILVETLGGGPPRVITIGRHVRPMRPLESELRGAHREAIIDAIAGAYESKKPYRATARSRGVQVISEPFLSPLDIVNAVQVWAGPESSEPPERLPTGAWVWDVDRGTCLASPDVHAVYRMPPEKALTEISRVQSMFGVTTAARHQEVALARVMAGQVGTQVHEVWKIWRYDDVLRDFHFAARLSVDNDGKRWLHGVTQDITEGPSAIADPLTFADSLMEAEMASQAGAHAALVDLRTLTAIRWLSAPMPSVQCEMTGHPERDPAIHPEDVATAKALAEAVRTAPAEGCIRVRSSDGGWIRINIVASLVILDETVTPTAALVKVRADSS